MIFNCSFIQAALSLDFLLTFSDSKIFCSNISSNGSIASTTYLSKYRNTTIVKCSIVTVYYSKHLLNRPFSLGFHIFTPLDLPKC